MIKVEVVLGIYCMLIPETTIAKNDSVFNMIRECSLSERIDGLSVFFRYDV